MGARASARHALRLLFRYPDLAAHYVRARLRVRQVLAEQKRGHGYSARPLGLTLKPVLTCNLRCRMCSYVANGAVDTNPKDSLPLDVWMRLMDDARQWRTYIWLTGGEPTLYPSIVPLIRYAKKQGLLCGMTTNGTTLEHFADALVTAKLDMLVVSLDGPEHVHNHIRGSSSAFQRATRGLAAVRSARARARRHKPVLIANCSLSADSYRSAHEMVRLAEELGADAVNVQHLWMLTPSMVAEHNRKWGRDHPVSSDTWAGTDASGVDGAEVADLVRRLRNDRSRVPILTHPNLHGHEIVVYYAHPSAFVRRRAAVCAWVNADILPNGDVSPCFDLVCGNIAEQPITDIWNNEAFRRHRQRLSVEGDLPICARCCAYWRRD